MKKIISLVIIVSIVFSLFTIVNANSGYDAEYEILPESMKESISKDDYSTLPDVIKKSIAKNGINQQPNLRSVTSTKFISGYNSFRTYVDKNFTQGSGTTQSLTCVPIAVANVLSYFDYRGYSNLVSGSSMSQSEFTQICSDCGWNYNKISLSKGISGMKTYANRKGYTVTSYYVGANWNTLKTYIGYNTPIIASDGEHAYTVLGYGIENGVNKVYVQIGVQDAVGKCIWVDWSGLGDAYAFVIN